MGFSLFGSKKNSGSGESNGFWKQLSDSDTLHELIQDSERTPQLIFKHSTRCIISRTVLNNFEADWSSEFDKVDKYFLDLLTYRSLSSEIAEVLKVEHQSPQLILIHKGQVILRRSHESIQASEVNKLLREDNA